MTKMLQGIKSSFPHKNRQNGAKRPWAFCPMMGFLPHMGVLPLLPHILFLYGRFAPPHPRASYPTPLGVLPHPKRGGAKGPLFFDLL